MDIIWASETRTLTLEFESELTLDRDRGPVNLSTSLSGGDQTVFLCARLTHAHKSHLYVRDRLTANQLAQTTQFVPPWLATLGLQNLPTLHQRHQFCFDRGDTLANRVAPISAGPV